MKRLPPLFFDGLDPQQSPSKTACDGADVVCMALDQRDESNEEDWNRPPTEADFYFCPVYVRTFRGLGAAEWAGHVHRQHQLFRFMRIVLDWGAGGGGPNVAKELARSRQRIPTEILRNGEGVDYFASYKETGVRPIFSANPGDYQVVGDPVLTLYKRGDVDIELLYQGQPMTKDDKLFCNVMSDFRASLEAGVIGLMPPFEKWPRQVYADWPQERIKILQHMGNLAEQLASARVVMKDDNPEEERRSQSGARHFTWGGKSDVAKALLYCHVGFKVFLKHAELDFEEGGGDGSDAGTLCGSVIG